MACRCQRDYERLRAEWGRLLPDETLESLAPADLRDAEPVDECTVRLRRAPNVLVDRDLVVRTRLYYTRVTFDVSPRPRRVLVPPDSGVPCKTNQGR